MEKLTEWERFRLTKEEKNDLNEYAAKSGKTKSQIFRNFIKTLKIFKNLI